jgi:hypothetical protein
LGRFCGVLAEKQGARALKKDDFFGFFHFFEGFLSCKPLLVRNLQIKEAFRKNRAEKPTVGFLIWTGSGKILA